MTWLPITDAAPGEICPRCDRGTLFIRSSRQTGQSWRLRYLRCKSCRSTFKARSRESTESKVL